jgi:ABC-type uncharacterized transport system substrate-binding protein
MPRLRGIFLLLSIVVLVGCSSQTPPTAQPTIQPTVQSTAQPTVQATQAAQANAQSVRILRLDSYHDKFPWSDQIHQGVVQGLKDNGYEIDGKRVTLDVHFMDTKRNTSAEYFEKTAKETMEYIRTTKPDIVLVSDDNATRLVVQPMRNEAVKFVILGLNGKPSDYQLDTSPNITGVLERPHIDELMGWIEKVFGKGTSVSMLAEDSATTKFLFGDRTVEKAAEKTTVKVAKLTFTNDYAAWQDTVKTASETSGVLFLGPYSTLRRADGTAVEPIEALKWTLENSKVPVMNFWEEAAQLGALGGPVISGYTQGYEAAVRAAKILGGTSPKDIPFSIPPRGKLIVNQTAVDRWKVKIPLDLLEVSEIVKK